MAKLIVVTEDLVRVTRESIKVSQRLREDVARLGRGPRGRRRPRLDRPGRVAEPASVPTVRLRRVK